MSEIRINCANARRQANKLRNAANECNQIVIGLRNAQMQIPNHWAGEAANTYTLELAERINKIRTMENELRSLASKIQQIADSFEETERSLMTRM